MKTAKLNEILERLLESSAASRYQIIKGLYSGPDRKEWSVRNVTRIRKELHFLLSSEDVMAAFPFIRKILVNDMPEIKKNIIILSGIGLCTKCIADLNCISEGYVKMTIGSLRGDLPDLFG